MGFGSSIREKCYINLRSSQSRYNTSIFFY